MLDQRDFKQIKEIVKTEADSLRKEFREDLKSSTDSLRKEFKQELKQELKPIKSDLAKIRRDVSMIVDFFDREYLNLRARVERIESFLRLPPLSEM